MRRVFRAEAFDEPSFSGRNPTNVKERASSPEPVNAVTAAVGPGIGITGSPFCMATEITFSPGSLTAGVPASLTSATA